MTPERLKMVVSLLVLTAGCGSSTQKPMGADMAVSPDGDMGTVTNADMDTMTNADIGTVTIPPDLATRGPDEVFKASKTGAGEFGSSVSVSGDTIAVGADKENVVGGPNGAGGAVYIFRRSSVTAWMQEARLQEQHPYSYNRFGSSLCLTDNTLAVSSGGVDGVTVFSRSNAWTQQGFIYGPLFISDPSSAFGWSVALSGADTLVVGDFKGTAYVFTTLSGQGLTPQASLKSSTAEAYFGESVSISGDTIAVGALGDAETGAVHVFRGSGDTWTEQPVPKGTGSDILSNFGPSVSVSGDTLAFSASNIAHVFTRSNGTWTEQTRFKDVGGPVSLSGDILVVGAPDENSKAGAAYVFKRSGTTWAPAARLTAAHPAKDDGFGQQVSISGDTVVVGAPNEGSDATGVGPDLDQNDNAPGSGAAYVFKLGQ